jgi:hypothetical protein
MSPFDFLPNNRRTALRIEPFLSAPSGPVPLPIEYRADLRLRGLGVVSVLPSPSAWGWPGACCAAAITDVKYSADVRPYEALSTPSSGRAGRMGGERVRCVVTDPSMDPYSRLTRSVDSHAGAVCPSNPRIVTEYNVDKQKTGVG